MHNDTKQKLEELTTIMKDKSYDERIDYLCKAIWNKPVKDIKYLLVTNYVHQQLLDEELTRTGLYQWINVFKGEVKYPRDVVDYNDYDIVQVNMSAQDINLVNTVKSQIRPDSKTKVILNNDYTTELWGMSFEYFPTLEREMSGADMIFGTEYFQTTALTELAGKPCYVIPHPADVKRLKSLTKLPTKNVISTIWRRYDMHSYIPALAVRNHGLTTQLLGHDERKDRKVYLTTTLYDYVFAGTNFFDFCDQMRESKIVYDPFTFHSFSRTSVDTAALGVPVIVSNRTQSGQICYPYTCVDPYDVTKARELITKLLTDEEFYKKVVDTALERVEFYNHDNSRERYLTSLYQALFIDTCETREYKKANKEKTRGDDVLKILANNKTRENEK